MVFHLLVGAAAAVLIAAAPLTALSAETSPFERPSVLPFGARSSTP